MKSHRHGFKLVLPTAMTLRWVEGSEPLLKQPQGPKQAEEVTSCSQLHRKPPRCARMTEGIVYRALHISQSILMKKRPPCGRHGPPSLSSTQFCQGDPGPRLSSGVILARGLDLSHQSPITTASVTAPKARLFRVICPISSHYVSGFLKGE